MISAGVLDYLPALIQVAISCKPLAFVHSSRHPSRSGPSSSAFRGPTIVHSPVRTSPNAIRIVLQPKVPIVSNTLCGPSTRVHTNAIRPVQLTSSWCSTLIPWPGQLANLTGRDPVASVPSLFLSSYRMGAGSSTLLTGPNEGAFVPRASKYENSRLASRSLLSRFGAEIYGRLHPSGL